MKNKIHRDLPWKPMHWVGGNYPVRLELLDDDSVKKYAAVKATSAILRAMRK